MQLRMHFLQCIIKMNIWAKNLFFFGISPIETNTDAIQVQVAGFAKNEQICFYHIHSIRHRGYYLFHCPILCGIYSRVAFIDISELEPHPHATPTFSVYTVGVACGRG